MKKQPRPHQRRALGDIVPSAKKHERLTVIMPCGTGKTLVQLWTAEALKPKTVLVLLPSLSLLRQTLHAWMAETKWEKPEVLCVCSDKTVSRKSEDEITISPEDIGHPVTSDSDEIAEFLAKKTAGVKLVFSTYHSSPLVAVGMKKNTSFDLGVFDEAHVTAGQEGGFFSFALKDEHLRIKTRTFWTATPRHYDLSKNEGGDAPLAYSMDDTSIYGPVVHKLAFSEAVKQGIICDYEILVPVITNKMLGTEEIEDGEVLIQDQKVPAKIVAHHMALNQAIKRHGVRKIFSFHPRVADAEEFTNGGPQSVARHIPKGFKVFHVNGGMTTADREAKVDEFRDANRALMSNARCLTQGIDVPAVDMVAFLSKKRSLIDIVQATGRAMRKAPGKTKGYILVPLYIEQDQGEALEAAVQRADFREVWAVLNAMREQDEALTETMSRVRSEQAKGKARGGKSSTLDIDKVTVLGPEVDLHLLRASIATICIDRLLRSRKRYATWQEASRASITLGIRNQRDYQKRYPEDVCLPGSPYLAFKDFPGWFTFLGREKKALYASWQEASRAIQGHILRSKWDYKGEYKNIDPMLPRNPERFYEDFPGWQVFLGTERKKIYLTCAEASDAAKKLGMKTCTQYLRGGYAQDPCLPAAPDQAYPDWPGWSDFLGNAGRKSYDVCKEAMASAARFKFASKADYMERCKKSDRLLPVTPHVKYEDFPGWDVYLGGEPKTRYTDCAQASEAARCLGFLTREEYIAGYSRDRRLPSNPNQYYRDFPGWRAFLGRAELYPDWRQAGAAAKKLGFKSSVQYRERHKEDASLPSVPESTYKDFPGWPKFLSTERP